jgi:hypothetical protein
VTVSSFTSGPVEVRLVRLRGMADCPPARLRIGGWPLDPASELFSLVVPLEEGGALDDAGSLVREEPQPMGTGLVVPWVGTSKPASDGLYAVVGFGGNDVPAAVEAARLAKVPSLRRQPLSEC